MSFEWFISCRYLRAKRKQKFISLISVISVLGVAVGVMALIIVLSVYTGFTEGLRDQIIGINAHALIQGYGGSIEDPEALAKEVEDVPGVSAAMPYIYGQALISSGPHSTGVILRGIDPKRGADVLSLNAKMKTGSLADLDNTQPGPPAIIIGTELARQLQVHRGSKIRLIAPNGPLTPMGVLPKIKTCRVAGIFETGMYEYDATLGFINLKTARSIVGLDAGAHGLEVKVATIEEADKVADLIRQNVPGYSVRDWMEINQNLFAALKLEKVGIFIALDLIILVAALNIISALIMVVMEKNRDIAILKSMGANTGQIMRIFFYQGMVIGLTGTILGVCSGLTACWVLARYQFIELPRNVYPMSTLPIKVVPMDVTVIAISAMLITLAATLYPSWKASRVRPAEALTYE